MFAENCAPPPALLQLNIFPLTVTDWFEGVLPTPGEIWIAPPASSQDMHLITAGPPAPATLVKRTPTGNATANARSSRPMSRIAPPTTLPWQPPRPEHNS